LGWCMDPHTRMLVLHPYARPRPLAPLRLLNPQHLRPTTPRHPHSPTSPLTTPAHPLLHPPTHPLTHSPAHPLLHSPIPSNSPISLFLLSPLLPHFPTFPYFPATLPSPPPPFPTLPRAQRVCPQLQPWASQAAIATALPPILQAPAVTGPGVPAQAQALP
jgi:hypothetical protein